MPRMNIYDIICNSSINLEAEYQRLYVLFYQKNSPSLRERASEYFYAFDRRFIGRAISLDDFDKYYGFIFNPNFENIPFWEHTSDDLFIFCEYLLNICFQLRKCGCGDQSIKDIEWRIKSIVEDLGHTPTLFGDIYVIVENNSAAFSAAELTKDELAAQKVIQYNHFKVRGNCPEKKSILKMLADDIEPDRKKLTSINSTLSNQLFEMLNRFVRHNNSDNEYISSLPDEELEGWYDDIYQMWLLAKLELDNLERKQRVAEVLTKIRG